jgi:hypothetical protein
MGSRLVPCRCVVVCLFVVFLSSCGGGGGGGGVTSQPVSTHTVALSWAPNHEKGVNSTGGGYQVTISGQPTITVPYVSGPTAPTSTVTTLQIGNYTVTVRAFAALDAQGGSTGTGSAPSQSLTINITR